MIQTTRLNLIPATVEILRAEQQGRQALSARLGVPVPEQWPPELYDAPAMAYAQRQLALGPVHQGWWFYYFCGNSSSGAACSLGAGGYKGPPGTSGEVEIGYSILPPYRRRGFASEAAAGLVRHAFKFPNINTVIAETYPHLLASIRVLEKNGFVPAGGGSEPGVVRYRINRDQLS